MRKLLALALLFCAPILAIAQAEVIEKSFPYSNQTVDVDMDLGTGLSVQAWDKNEISIKITYLINEGKNNDALKLDLDNDRGRLSVNVDVDFKGIEGAESICCCNNKKKSSITWKGEHGQSICADVLVEIKMPAASDLLLKTVVADVNVEGMTGNVDVETVTGLINLNWPETQGAKVSMKTTTGAVYTNLDIESKKEKGLNLISSHDIEGTYKNGDKEVFLKTVTSDIYFKKSGH